ncbi:polysaccharide pyruvyl transferase family protein [Anaerobacillus sp. HL2]|nr:polysaccharide pyruvyl transferase family protein [Anaerobacillus sp. HL2]
MENTIQKKLGVDKIAIYKSPFEFLRYIRDAEYIVTNSFHGTAFALNFNKQFITVGRQNSIQDLKVFYIYVS